MAELLSAGAIAAILSDEQPERPVFQVLGAKILTSSSTERVRLNISDGEYHMATTMLATQLNHLVKENKIEKYAIIQVNKYQVSVLQESRHILLCLEVDVLKTAQEVGERIGDPISTNQFVKGSTRTKPNTGSTPADTNGTTSHKSPKNTGKMQFHNSDAPKTPGGTPVRVMQIANLTPYQNKWTIKARVSQKGDIREWKNARGEGKLFSFTMLDESGDIRATGFKDEVDKFYNLLEAGKVYYVSNATLKPANRQYNNTTHDYEMTLRRESAIIPCEESEVGDVPKVLYNFVSVSKLSNHMQQMVDVIGVIKSSDDVQSIMIKSQNRETKRRNITLVDQSNVEVRITLWGDEADKFNPDGNPVVACKSLRVSDFGGCSLSTVSSSMIQRNPDIKEAYDMKQWYETGGSTQATQSLTSAAPGSGMAGGNWKSLTEIKDQNLGMGEKPEYLMCKATISYCKKENLLYQACPTENCNKKVVDLQNGSYRCEKCNNDFQEFKYRMILNLSIADDTGTIWVTCFQEQGEILLDTTSQKLGDLRENNEAQFDAVLKKTHFASYFFKLRVKVDRYNDEERLRSTVVNVSPIVHREYGKKLIADIEKLSKA